MMYITYRVSSDNNNMMDHGFVYYAYPNWRSDHSSLWSGQTDVSFLWLPNAIWIYNATYCCNDNAMLAITPEVFEPDWLQGHQYVTDTQLAGHVNSNPLAYINASLFYHPDMASSYYTEADGSNLSLRWDNIPDAQNTTKLLESLGNMRQYIVTRFTNFLSNQNIPSSVFTVPPHCNPTTPSCTSTDTEGSAESEFARGSAKLRTSSFAMRASKMDWQRKLKKNH